MKRHILGNTWWELRCEVKIRGWCWGCCWERRIFWCSDFSSASATYLWSIQNAISQSHVFDWTAQIDFMFLRPGLPPYLPFWWPIRYVLCDPKTCTAPKKHYPSNDRTDFKVEAHQDAMTNKLLVRGTYFLGVMFWVVCISLWSLSSWSQIM